MAEGVTRLMVSAFDGDKVDEYMEKNFNLPEYVETVDADSLEPVDALRANTLVAIAARIGRTRLIDNTVLA